MRHIATRDPNHWNLRTDLALESEPTDCSNPYPELCMHIRVASSSQAPIWDQQLSYSNIYGLSLPKCHIFMSHSPPSIHFMPPYFPPTKRIQGIQNVSYFVHILTLISLGFPPTVWILRGQKMASKKGAHFDTEDRMYSNTPRNLIVIINAHPKNQPKNHQLLTHFNLPHLCYPISRYFPP